MNWIKRLVFYGPPTFLGLIVIGYIILNKPIEYAIDLRVSLDYPGAKLIRSVYCGGDSDGTTVQVFVKKLDGGEASRYYTFCDHGILYEDWGELGRF
jgi:hypothetical protein